MVEQAEAVPVRSVPAQLPAHEHSGSGLTSALTNLWRISAERGAPRLAIAPGADGELSVVWANRAALDLLGLRSEDLVRRPLGAVTDAGDWRAVAASLLASDGDELPSEIRREDQTTVPVRVGVVPAGSAWLVTLTPTLDGALSAAEEALREAEHRFRALAEHAPIGIFVSEAGLRLGYVNTRFAALAGLEPDRLLGTGWLDVVSREDVPAMYDALQTVLDGHAVELTLRFTPVGDAQRWAHVRLAPATTPRRAAGFIGTLEDITARRAWEEQLAYQANHDPLTGLANRRRLIDTLTDLLDSRRANDRRFGVLFADLDGFKQVNDTLGHDAGDRVLVEVARRLTRTARDHDLLARVAGDEFVVVLRNIDGPGDAESAAARHLAGLAAPIFVGGRDVFVSASFGIAMPLDGDTPESLLRAADHVMYAAKAVGPGHYRMATDREVVTVANARR